MKYQLYFTYSSVDDPKSIWEPWPGQIGTFSYFWVYFFARLDRTLYFGGKKTRLRLLPDGCLLTVEWASPLLLIPVTHLIEHERGE